MDNKDKHRACRPNEERFTLVYPGGWKTVDRSISRYDNETNRQERPTPTKDFREKRHGQ